MKKDGPAQQALVKAIVAGNQATAKENLLTLQQGIAEAQTFWVANKRTDALEFSRTVLKKLDGLDKLISTPNFDSTVALAAVQDLNKSCSAERVQQRERLANGVTPALMPQFNRDGIVRKRTEQLRKVVA